MRAHRKVGTRPPHAAPTVGRCHRHPMLVSSRRATEKNAEAGSHPGEDSVTHNYRQADRRSRHSQQVPSSTRAIARGRREPVLSAQAHPGQRAPPPGSETCEGRDFGPLHRLKSLPARPGPALASALAAGFDAISTQRNTSPPSTQPSCDRPMRLDRSGGCRGSFSEAKSSLLSP